MRTWVALLGPWAVRPRLPHVTLATFARGPGALSAPTRRASTAATVPSHPAPPRDVRESALSPARDEATIMVLSRIARTKRELEQLFFLRIRKTASPAQTGPEQRRIQRAPPIRPSPNLGYQSTVQGTADR